MRTLIVESAPMVRKGLQSFLEGQSLGDVVDTAGTNVEALLAVRDGPVDVVVIGSSVDGISTNELIRRLHQESAGAEPARVIGVVVIVDHEDDVAVSEALRAGATALLTTTVDAEELRRAVHTVATGESMLAPSITHKLVRWFQNQSVVPEELMRSHCATLTPREEQVLTMIARGLTTDEIANELVIGLSTVRTHVYRLRHKLQLSTSAQLVSFAYRSGMMREQVEGTVGA